MNINEIIQAEEKRYNDELESAVNSICSDAHKWLVLISGGSSAGKTTSTMKLSEKLIQRGRPISMISLDDFYLNTQFDEAGNIVGDVESPDALDLDYLKKCLVGLENGETVLIPTFDFKLKRRTDEYKELQLESGEVCFVEGLHALNPGVYGKIARNHIYKLYLEAVPNPAYSIKTPRLLRRLVRDYYHRAASAELTFSMWKGVVEGEKKYIKPYINDIDKEINTFHKYETGMLKYEAEQLLKEVSADSVYYNEAMELLSELSGFECSDSSLVPPTSLLKEFLN